MYFRLGLLVIVLLTSSAHAQNQPNKKESQQPKSWREYISKQQGRQAYGIYLQGKKLGWMIEDIKLGEHDGQPVAIFSEQGKLSASFFGAKTEMEMNTTQIHSLEGNGEILYAKHVSREDGSESVLTATRDKDELVITMKAGGETTTRRVPMSKDTLLAMWKSDQWLSGPPKKGDTFDSVAADWEQSDVDVKETFTFIRNDSIVWGGVPTKVSVLEINVQGLKGEATVANAGRIIKGKMAGLLDIRAEEEEVAKTFGKGTVDLLSASSIRIKKRLGDPEKISELTLKVRGIDDYKLPQSHRQQSLALRKMAIPF